MNTAITITAIICGTILLCFIGLLIFTYKSKQKEAPKTILDYILRNTNGGKKNVESNHNND